MRRAAPVALRVEGCFLGTRCSGALLWERVDQVLLWHEKVLPGTLVLCTRPKGLLLATACFALPEREQEMD